MDLDDDELKATRDLYNGKKECKYCTDNTKISRKKLSDELRISRAMFNMLEVNKNSYVSINYCPMCGRKLVKND